MPGKLIALMALMGINAAMSFADGRYVVGTIQVLILAGVAAGNEAVRKLLIALNGLSLVVSVVFGAIAFFAGPLAMLALASTIFGVVSAAFAIWVLTRPEVEHWMYKRSMKGAAD